MWIRCRLQWSSALLLRVNCKLWLERTVKCLCFRFGFCGKGEGFCRPPTRVGPAGKAPQSDDDDGCSLLMTEIVGGDLPRRIGGGGVKLDKDSADQCFIRFVKNKIRICQTNFDFRCDENPFCKWYTYDDTDKLCYLKDRRGYLSNSTENRFTSGATFRDGCEPDPLCTSPFSYHLHHQCFFHPGARGSFLDAGDICDSYGGFLPYSYEGYQGDSLLGDQWHWLNYGGGADTCYACRPSRWSQGVRRVSCDQQMHFACERRRLFPSPVPPRPDIIDSDLLDDTSLRPLSNDVLDDNFVDIDIPFLADRKRRIKSRRRFNNQRRSFYPNPFLNLAFG